MNKNELKSIKTIEKYGGIVKNLELQKAVEYLCNDDLDYNFDIFDKILKEDKFKQRR